ncbi:hypothetical protein DES40_0617 [Litorimonas taeanensis]|uniref:Uncharacterized protein n=1 Tax=Litorimonas taeanensis TaxID=568099 RepID=A0A420WJV6_9PROT|nr:hypothetical protein [Litorimonas taeanensis]RKQ71304.1 hypothetical protein DES40_0617 [Litorimonas taeanensis]
MTDTPPSANDDTHANPRRRAANKNRVSRYQRAQERRAAQAKSDQKFYAGIFSLIGVTALFAILLGAISINGVFIDMQFMENWTKPWIGSLTKLEAGGLAFVGVIALSVYLRMRYLK